LTLSKDLSDGIKALSRQEDSTLFMTLLASFLTLLHRYTGQDDIVVGSPIAGRNRPEIEGLIGFFVNTLVLRSSFSGNPTFKELLARVRQSTLEAYDHQDLPFEKLQEDLNPERSLSHSPLFQAMLAWENASPTNPSFEGLGVSPLRIGADMAKFDLTLSMRESIDGLRGSLQYNTDLFDNTTIKRLLAHFERLLEGIVSNSDERVVHLPMLTDAEQHHLLIEWNDTKKEYSKHKCIHEVFEEQVEKTPDAIAVVFENQQVTYRELNVRANQLAHYLIQQAVGPEVLIGICMERFNWFPRPANFPLR
jgi:non-ribosomal peptide synthetase component F